MRQARWFPSLWQLATLLPWIATPLLPALAAHAEPPRTLTLATWNLEWLMTPQTHAMLRPFCTRDGEGGGRARSIPCDVARDLARGPQDYERLAAYAQRLDADVIAIQEVDGPAAAKLVFPDHDFCFTARRAVQNNGFAIRRSRGIRYRCDIDVHTLAVGHEHLRAGVQMTLFPDSAQELHLLGVHLKSGCAAERLDSGGEACELLAKQVLPLKAWIDAQARAGHRFMLLGDFNRRLARERGAARDAAGRLVSMWPELAAPDLPGAELVSLTADQPYLKCHVTERHGAYIDHIVAGEKAAQRWLPATLRRVSYVQSDAARLKLSDHCPLSVQYRLLP
ncbi:MAG: endonuclease/exonuclease/phosphatase family protein [Proteobacteria bacterium]|nr:endonuclease/exonuclease/phosphatase family protein [Pseudomonadota bacterium]